MVFGMDRQLPGQNGTESTAHPQAPPIAEPPYEWYLPEYQHFELSNGIPVWYIEDPSLQLLRVRILSRTGADHEEIPGLARITMALLTKGTTSRSAQQIAEEVEFLGATLSARASWDSCVIAFSVLSEYANAIFPLVADILRNPTFPEEELERLKRQQVALLQQSMFDPDYQASFALQKVLYTDCPYNHPLDGTLDAVEQIHRTDCQKFYFSSFVPGNIFIVAAGQYPGELFQQMVEEHLGQWRTETVAPAAPVNECSFPENPQLGIVAFPPAVQAEVRIAFPAPHYHDSLYPAYVLAHTLFSGAFLSRLNHILREEKGYTYGVHGTIVHHRYAHVAVVMSSFGNHVLDNAIRDLMMECEQFSRGVLDSNQVMVVRRYLLGNFAMQLEKIHTVMDLLSAQIFYHLPENFYTLLYQKLRTVSTEELTHVQRQYFRPDRFVVGASGDPDRIRKAFAQWIRENRITIYPMEATIRNINEEE